MRSLIVLSMLVLASCTTIPTSYTTVPNARLITNPFDTIASRPSVLNTASTSGTINVTGDCVTLSGGRFNGTLLWPEGTEYSLEGTRLFIVLPETRGRVAVGKSITLAGSTFRSSDRVPLPEKDREGCPGPYFAVSTA